MNSGQDSHIHYRHFVFQASKEHLHQLLLELSISSMNERELILYRDEDILALNKPSRCVAHRQKRDDLQEDARELAERLARVRPGSLRAINRLDADTTGIMLFASNKRAARHYSSLFASRKVRKQYLAIVWGSAPECFEIRGSIKACSKRSFVVKDGGKAALSKVTAIEELRSKDDKDLSFCKVDLQTGRKHQIRAHLSSQNLPIVGDKLYGGDDYLEGFGPVEHPLLHAYHLALPQKGGRRLVIEARLPKHFGDILVFLRQKRK